MKLLHITPHLGGGIGKSLAAISTLLPESIEQTFLLLETPINRRYIDAIVAAGHEVIMSEGPAHVAKLAKAADIVQIEFINHPRLFECLARTNFPAMRSVIWAHISGLFKPYIHPGLIAQAQRFVFTSNASMKSPTVELLSQEAKDKLSVIDSGFGFEPQEEIIARTMPVIGYLGTVNFVKMHKGFFEAIDHLEHNAKAIIYGAIDPVVQDYAKTMNNSHRFEFRGETATPDAAFAEMDIFFYPLQPEHYGTGENALVEAMSTGLPVVVLHNPAEMEIVSHRKTGLVADSIYNCNMWLDKLIRSRELRKTIGYNAAIYAATMKTPKRAAISFMRLWESMLKEAPKRVNFSEAIGQTPAEWFLATQRLPGMVYEPGQQEATATKGSLAHFQKVFKNDASFAALG